MKRLKYLLVLLVVLGLVGCGTTKKDEDKKSDKKKKEEPVEDIIIEKAEIDLSYFDWVGYYEEETNSSIEKSLGIYVDVSSGYLYLGFDITGDESQEYEMNSVSFAVEDVNDNEIVFDDSFLHIKGKLVRENDTITVILDEVEEPDEDDDFAFDFSVIAGTYTKAENKSDLMGVFELNDNILTINPTGDTSYVSLSACEKNDCQMIDMPFEVVSNDELVYDDDDDKIVIKKTEDGIKITSNNKKYAGEYKVKE